MPVPRALYSSPIISYIKDILSYDYIDDFYALSDIHQDKLAALAMQALGNDIDIVLDDASRLMLTRNLISGDKDDETEAMQSIKECVREQLAPWLDEIIQEQVQANHADIMVDAGYFTTPDMDTGEMEWRKYA